MRREALVKSVWAATTDILLWSEETVLLSINFIMMSQKYLLLAFALQTTV